jgi:hypothetical protein
VPGTAVADARMQHRWRPATLSGRDAYRQRGERRCYSKVRWRW